MNSKNNPVEVVTMGHLTLDDVVIQYGSTNFDQLGGASLYSAAGANFWNKHVGLCTRRGYDYSKEMVESLESHGLNLEGARAMDCANIHIWALYDKYGHRYFITQEEGGNYVDMAPYPEDIPESYLKNAKAYHLAPFPPHLQENVIKGLPSDVIISLDPHHEYLTSEYKDQWAKTLSKVTIFMPSEGEFVPFWGIKKQEDLKGYLPYLKKTAELGPKIVALKVGPRGAIIYSAVEDKAWVVPPYIKDEDIVDVTGGGDSFCGGFLSGYLATKDPYEACLRGMVSSSFILEKLGAIGNFLHTEEEVQARLTDFQSQMDREKCRIL